MAWTGDTLTGTADTINNLLLEQPVEGYQDLKGYPAPVFDRVQRVVSTENQFVGAGAVGRILTDNPNNAMPRKETEDVPLPLPDGVAKFTITPVEYMVSVGLTKRELEEVSGKPRAIATLADIKLKHLKNSIVTRLNQAFKGDGTGRLARVVSATGSSSPWTLTVDNSAYDFGWDTTKQIVKGQLVDILDVDSAVGTWAVRGLKLKVTAVTATTIEVSEVSGVSTVTNMGNLADNDVVFAANSVSIDGSNDATFNDSMGILGIVDAGASAVSATANTRGGWKGATFQGLTRTSYEQLMPSSITKSDFFSSSVPGPWDIEDLLQAISDVGETGGEGITELWAHPDMIRCIARKAYLGSNATVPTTDQKVTGGYWTEQLRTGDGQLVPLIPMRRMPKNFIYGVNKNDLRLYQPVPIRFETFGHGPGPFIPVPGSRNGTYEAWMRCIATLGATRVDNMFKLEGLAIE